MGPNYEENRNHKVNANAEVAQIVLYGQIAINIFIKARLLENLSYE